MIGFTTTKLFSLHDKTKIISLFVHIKFVVVQTNHISIQFFHVLFSELDIEPLLLQWKIYKKLWAANDIIIYSISKDHVGGDAGMKTPIFWIAFLNLFLFAHKGHLVRLAALYANFWNKLKQFFNIKILRVFKYWDTRSMAESSFSCARMMKQISISRSSFHCFFHNIFPPDIYLSPLHEVT